MKIDPYNHKERYLIWKERSLNEGIEGLTKENSEIIMEYILDMELGLNVAISSKKGSRSHARLNNIKQRIIFLAKQFDLLYEIKDLTKITERELHTYFTGMRDGTIRRFDGKAYSSSADYVKIFKAFWHWYQKISRKKDLEIIDITLDLDTSREKPRWVYLTEEQIKRLCENAKYEYKVLIMFLFDTGIRAPTELINIKVSDLINNCKELMISEEISKTFGRRIKLMISSEIIKEYIQNKNLSGEDYLFKISPLAVNQYLKRLARRIFGDEKSLAGQNYSDLTMYDFRHCSCCYWLPRYKSESALKFRFGWKKSDKIHYYSEMLGMRDTISDEDMLVDVTKTEIEQRLMASENEKEVLKERIHALENQMSALAKSVKEALMKGREILVV